MKNSKGILQMGTSDRQLLDNIVTSIRTKLPIQNPLHSFVHNNILQRFEEKDFHEALEDAGKLYRARLYWPIHRYTEKFHEGKITDIDIFRAIDHYQGHYKAIPSLDKLGLSTREYFYRMMFSELIFNDDDLQPDISDKHLWDLCSEKSANNTLKLSRSVIKWRGRDYWEKYHQESFALTAHPMIIRLISSFLDQGQSFWANPFAKNSFWNFFLYDISALKNFSEGWIAVLSDKSSSLKNLTPEDVIIRELSSKGIPKEIWEDYLLEILFDLKGWAGMVNKLELEPWQATVKAPAIRLVDYVAAILLIESAIDTYHAEAQSIDLSFIHGRSESIELKSFQLTLALYQITKSFKLDDRWMQKLSSEELMKIIDEIDSSEIKDRVRLWHEAYEHHFHREALEAIYNHKIQGRQSPYAQVLFCIDDREESIRRHVEEIDQLIETFGVVGFFGIDMKFSSVKSKRLVAQCPPVVSPSRIISEIPKAKDSSFHKKNELSGSGDLWLYYNSRTLFRGFLSTLFLGIVSLFPMFISVFFPQSSKRIKERMLSWVNPVPETDLSIELGEEGHGYSKKEMAGIVAAIIRMCGFETNISELVILIAHGSTSNNNPFKQAYGCGACGGNAGVPNSRAFAKMANDKEVREELKKLNLIVPDKTFFVAGFHDTSTDEFHFYNESELPSTHQKNFERLKKNLNEAAKLNAFEKMSAVFFFF